MCDVAILQDLGAILVFIVVLALASLFASHGAVTPGIGQHALLVLGGSLLAGAALGYAAAQYVHVIEGHLEWVLLVIAFVISQALRLAGLDPVLVALAAGIMLRNVSQGRMASERVRAELARCAVPVYVVFFALAGSNLRLGALAVMWPWALLFAGLRAVGLWAGFRWAGRHGTINTGLVDYGWLGLISQGGLALTLASILRRAFPEWNVSLEALAVALIGAHQLVGPVCFQWALRRAGEISRVEDTHERISVGSSTGTGPLASPTSGTGVVTTGSGMY
jgi:Kef-type K+ transport system membrane component KefB